MAKYRMGGKIGKSSNGDLNHQGQSTSDFVSKMNKLYGGNKTNFGHMLDNFRKLHMMNARVYQIGLGCKNK